MPPEALTCIDEIASPFDATTLEIAETDTGEITLTLNDSSSVAPCLSVAVTVTTFDVSGPCAVPLIAPVELLTDTQDGPLFLLYLIGVQPPDADAVLDGIV